MSTAVRQLFRRDAHAPLARVYTDPVQVANLDVHIKRAYYGTVDGGQIDVTARTRELGAACMDPSMQVNTFMGGDPAPGVEKKLHLLARRLILPHPRGGMIDVTAPLPEHMRKTFEMFGCHLPLSPRQMNAVESA